MLKRIPFRQRIIGGVACAAVAALGLTSIESTPAAAQRCSTTTTTSVSYGISGGIGYTTTTKVTTCVTKYRQWITYVIGWSDEATNRTLSPLTFSCYSTAEATVKYDVSATIGLSWKPMLLVELRAGLSAGLSESLSTGKGSTITMSVPKGKTGVCQRRLIKWYFTGTKTITTTVDKTVTGWGTRVKGYPKTTTTTADFSASAPQSNSAGWYTYLK
ncbi:MAG: hypothetical protein LBR19_02680 [Bifidobacteriaceae bacterium]|jgi:hypothetical protein|nr:hypothetical protein [Bifidobacteriaceae bacterium]